MRPSVSGKPSFLIVVILTDGVPLFFPSPFTFLSVAQSAQNANFALLCDLTTARFASDASQLLTTTASSSIRALAKGTTAASFFTVFFRPCAAGPPFQSSIPVIFLRKRCLPLRPTWRGMAWCSSRAFTFGHLPCFLLQWYDKHLRRTCMLRRFRRLRCLFGFPACPDPSSSL